MDAVRYHTCNPIRVGEDRTGRVGHAVFERGHGIEQVSGVPDAHAVTRICFVHIRHRVSHADDDTSRRQFLDKGKRAGQLGREGDKRHTVRARPMANESLNRV